MARKSKSKAVQHAAQDQLSTEKDHFGPKPVSDEMYSSEAEESDSEVEDETGDLVTEDLDRGINEVLRTLRENPEALKDKDRVFYPEIGAEGTGEARERVSEPKVVRLKDYQREALLRGKDDEEQEEHAPFETYEQQKNREKDELVKQINEAADEDGADGDGDDDGFLQKRKEQREVEPATDLELPDPEKNPEEFLNAFVSGRAWINRDEDKIPTYDQVVDGDNEDSDGFDDLSEKFETAYNFRYEDPAAAEIVSYARDQNTLRRKNDSSRRRQRDKKREERERKEQQHKHEVAQLRKHKISETTAKLERLQKVLGDEEVAGMFTEKDLEGEWDDTEWDKRMQRLFDDEFYSRQDKDWKPPTGGDNDNAGEDHGTDSVYLADTADAADDTEGNYADMDMNVDGEIAEEPNPLQNLSKKDLKRKAAEFVDSNTDLLLDETYKPSTTFRYREVEPESYGLTARDILLASDKQLNQFVGLKKLASYRDPGKAERDKKRYSKARRLREWRRETFGADDEPSLELWEKLKQENAAEQPRPTKKKRKH